MARRRRRPARADGDGWRVDGTKVHVADGGAADLFLVTARDADGVLGVFAVQGDDDGVRGRADADGRRQPQGSDASRSTARSGWRLGAGDATDAVARDARPARGRVRGRRCRRRGARAGSSRSSTRRSACSSTSRSARSRRCSTCAPTCCARVELGRAAGYYACWAADDADPDEAHRAAVDGQGVREPTRSPQLGGSAIQVFGGIGFTWEHDIHLYYKRLLSLSASLGQPRANTSPSSPTSPSTDRPPERVTRTGQGATRGRGGGSRRCCRRRRR